MPLFITADPGALHGVYAEEQPPPATISGTGTGTSVIVGQLPWGPPNLLQYPGSMAAFFAMYAPAGMTRTGSAYMSVIRKVWPLLGAVRVADPAAVAAHATVTAAGPTNVLTVPARYTGTEGNALVAVVTAADDGNANHFNLTVSVTSASGSTSETYRNLNISGTGADVLPNVANSLLIAACTKLVAGLPTVGTYTFGSGTNGTVTSTHYLGTQGTGGLYGLALTEGDDTINHIFFDDPGNSIRAACNAGMLAHVVFVTNRVGYITGPSAQTQSQAATDVANYVSQYIAYIDPWVNVADNVTGATALIPGASFAASVAAQLPASVSGAWKRDTNSNMLAGISSLETVRGPQSRAANTQSGICTLFTRRRGGFAFESWVNTSQTSGIKNLTRTRMNVFIAQSVEDAWQPFVDAPNVPFFQQDLVNSLDNFSDGLKRNASVNPANAEAILDYLILPLSSTNTPTTLAAGDFTVGAQFKYFAGMSRIFLSMQAGETVVIQPS